MKQFFVKNLFVISLVCVVMLVVVWPYASQMVQERQNFRKIFGVPVPLFMNQERHAALQKVVTRRLLELSAEIITSDGMPCAKSDKECADMKNLYIAMSQRDLRKASEAASAKFLHLNLSISVPTCGDGYYPVDEKCIDGSVPHGLE
jgi:hypothetical protein